MCQIVYRLVSSLEKIFADEEPQAMEHTCGSMLKNEQFSFQLAVKPEEELRVKLRVDSPLRDCIQMFRVENVPCGMSSYQGRDDEDYLRKERGCFPIC